MNPVLEISLIVGRELRKSLRSLKGILLFALSVLGGVAASLGYMKLEAFKRSQMPDATPENIRAFREALLTKVYDDELMGKFLAASPEVLYLMCNITIWLGPLLVAFLGFDLIAGDVQHRGVRYWTVRSRRSSYMIGKFLGLWTVISLITLIMNLFIWVGVIARGEAGVAETLGWGLRFWAITLPISAAWCGLATFVGSLFKSPYLALLVIFASFFGLWLVWIIGNVSGTKALMYVYPNFYDAWLLSPRFEKVSGAFGVLAAMAAATMAAGSVLFARRDV